MILFDGDSCWEELAVASSFSHMLNLVCLHFQSQHFIFQILGLLPLYVASTMILTESGWVFMTPSVTSLPSALLQTSLYILTFTFLWGVTSKMGLLNQKEFEQIFPYSVKLFF